MIILVTGVFLVAAVLVCLRRPQPIHKADAIKVLGFIGDPKSEPGTNLWRLTVVVSNTTMANFVEVAFPTLQTRREGIWINVAEALDPAENYASYIGPQACATQTIVYVTSRPDGDWRLRFFVTERLTGAKGFIKALRNEKPLIETLLRPRWAFYGEVVSPVFGANTVTSRMAEVRK